MTEKKIGQVTDLHAELTPSLRALVVRGEVRKYAKKTVLISEGEAGDSLYVVLAGSVKAYSVDASGREITYGVISAGDYFGEMSLDGGPRSASVMTLEACTCAVLTRSDVSEHLASEPGFAIALVVKVIQRARAATEVARSMALLDVYSRMSTLLQQGLKAADYAQPLKQNADKATNIEADQAELLKPHTIESTHLDIASRVGASREAISRILKQLENSGHVILNSKRITLLRRLPEQL